jgi:hypothetical protein
LFWFAFQYLTFQDLAEIRSALQTQQQNREVIEEKIATVTAFQQLLTRRIEAVSHPHPSHLISSVQACDHYPLTRKILALINSHQQALSTAEVEYHRELQEQKKKLGFFRQKLDEVIPCPTQLAVGVLHGDY